MAKSRADDAYGVAFDVICEWLEVLRPGAGNGRAESAKATIDIERLVRLLALLRETARKQPGDSPDKAGKQPGASTAAEGGTIGGEVPGRQEKPSSKRSPKQAKVATTYSEDFELVWHLWPNGSAKAAAFELWAPIPLDDRRRIYSHVKDRVGNDPKWVKAINDGDFKLHFRTFLSQKRYEDDYQKTTHAAPEAPEFYCHPCGGGFGSQAALEAHNADYHGAA